MAEFVPLPSPAALARASVSQMALLVHRLYTEPALALQRVAYVQALCSRAAVRGRKTWIAGNAT